MTGGAQPARVLMTLDAVGGVWRYALDLARACPDVGFVLAGFGPRPSPSARAEAEALANVELTWGEEPLDWIAEAPEQLAGLPETLAGLAERRGVGLVHLNAPSQACGLRRLLGPGTPVIAVSHSCVVTWWDAVRGSALPAEWRWRRDWNRRGFDEADVVVAPSRSHGAHLAACYGRIGSLRVVLNGADGRAPTGEDDQAATDAREPFVFAAGRWWDAGKNAGPLDAAAREAVWPVRMAGRCDDGSGQAVSLRHAEALGELPHAQVLAWMGRAGVVASPSLYEPFGLVALEAAVGGAPLLLADIPTYRELWDGAAAFFDPRDAGALVRAIDRLAGDPALRTDLARRARARAAGLSTARQAAGMRSVWAAAAAARATAAA